MVLFAAVVCLLGACLVAKGAQVGARRLGLDVLQVFLWLGLAERPLQPLPPRPTAPTGHQPIRRRSRSGLASSRTRRRTAHVHPGV